MYRHADDVQNRFALRISVLRSVRKMQIILSLTMGGIAMGIIASPAIASDEDPLQFDSPPAVGDRVLPQRTLFVCQSEFTARYMANTGFVAPDCTPVTHKPQWRVIACTRKSLPHGPWWSIEVEAADGQRAWIPLPWHDWS